MTDTALDDAATSRSTRYYDETRHRLACIACSDQLGMCVHCDRAYTRHARLAPQEPPEPACEVCLLPAHTDCQMSSCPRAASAEIIPFAVPFAQAAAEEIASDFIPLEPPLCEDDDASSYEYRDWCIDMLPGLFVASKGESDILIACADEEQLQIALDKIDSQLPEIME